jgi:acetylornithine deacetylase/succinyl-diaminopimelate desuccinylase-like protein
MRAETARLLAELIQIDTTNPPGNETAAAEHLAAYLTEAGVECELTGRTPERANLVARIPGTGNGPSLMFLGHTDVVEADPDEWSVPPLGGVDRDEMIWGRGALDMKGQVAAEAVAMASLAREGWRGAGDLVLCAVADEEVGIGYGLSWLVSERPELVKTDFAINEGGGERVEFGGRVTYTVGTGEKAIAPFAVTTSGTSGHASTPALADNALVKMTTVLERINGMELPQRILPELTVFAEAVGGPGMDPTVLVARAREEGSQLAAMVEPLLGTTVAPTRMEASANIAIIPNRCRLECDSRVLPGTTEADSEAMVRAALAGLDYELEFLTRHGGSISSPATPLYEAVESFLGELEEGAQLAPLLCAGYTDSHILREAFGTVAYGFMPRRMDRTVVWSLFHGADERALKDDLELAARCFIHVAKAVCE